MPADLGFADGEHRFDWNQTSPLVLWYGRWGVGMRPILADERIVLLDVLRGLAILGMFTVNMTADLPWGGSFYQQPLAAADRFALISVDLLANGRFITIFSVLFGLGFYVQLTRAEARGDRFLTIYLRRLLGLLLIACVAIVAGLNTHILADYAMFGALLLLFHKRSQRFLLVSMVVCFLAQKIPAVVSYYQAAEGQALATEQIAGSDATAKENRARTELNRIYSEGSFAEIAKARVTRLPRYLTSLEARLSDIDILALLLLGLYLGRRGLLADSKAREELARKALPWLLGIGAAGVVGFVVIEHFLSAAWDSPPLSQVKWAIAWPTGMVVLGLGYVAAITLLLERAEWRRLLMPLAAVGRLALTNYLITNLVFAVIAYSWGLALYGQVKPFAGLTVAVLVFPLQVVISQWWMRRFSFGPFEWCWRSMTYGKLPALRR